MKKIAIILTALTMVFALAGCNQNTEPNSSDSSAQTSSQVSESESSSTSSSEPSSSSEQPVDDYVEEGEHTVELCNGTGQAVTSLRIRPEDGEDDYWSLEILGDSPWEDGTVISLTLQREEWGDCTSWQAEATLADGTVENYSELPLTETGRVELVMGSFHTDDAAGDTGNTDSTDDMNSTNDTGDSSDTSDSSNTNSTSDAE